MLSVNIIGARTSVRGSLALVIAYHQPLLSDEP